MPQGTQHTLRKACPFEGKGLHTGALVRMTLLPAAPDSGIVFRRTDLSGRPEIPALAENVSGTARSTTLSSGAASVATVEHLLSALTGMGVDNAVVELYGPEVPILDGSARFYVEAFLRDGLQEQPAPRSYFDIPNQLEIKDKASGAWIKIEPACAPSAQVTIDFGESVLGVQQCRWDLTTDYALEIGPCRTFVFYRDIERLMKNGLIKGGDLENALVITEEGYLGNPRLRFPDECGRHKLLDLLGDLRLAGGWVNARITAYKPGHSLNTRAAQALRTLLK